MRITSLNNAFQEFTSYALIGLFCAILDLLLLFILVEYFNVWYLAAAIISFSVITFLGFFIQKKYTFKDYSKKNTKQLTFFIIISAIGLILNTFFMYFFVGVLGFWYIFSNIPTKIFVLLWNYFANKKITFKSNGTKV
jgi:putative flippase GtrA